MTSASPIFCLFKPGCPTAVPGFVIAVIVDAIECETIWSRSHVSKEVCELQPALAHFDTSATIMFVIATMRIRASVTHCAPRLPFRASIALFCLPMQKVCMKEKVTVETSARTSVSCAKFFALYDNFLAAITATSPKCFAVVKVAPHLDHFDCDKATETLACDIFDCGHGDLRERLPRQVAAGR